MTQGKQTAQEQGGSPDASEQRDPVSADILQSLAALLPEEMKDHYDPRRDLLRIVGDKWSVLVLLVLSTGTYRHALLRRLLNAAATGGEISQPVLTDILRKFERNGLIERRVVEEKPLKVEYELTAMGQGFTQEVLRIIAWGSDHLEQINHARTQFDAFYD